MIKDKKRKRFLKENGFSRVSEEAFKKAILEDNLYGKVVAYSEDAKAYEEKYNKEIISQNCDIPCDDLNTNSDYNKLEQRVLNSPRLNGKDKEYERIAVELDFIERSGSVKLFNDLIDLVDKFKKDNAVWGVGRGSSCACYVLYLLEVHDVDSLMFDISFKEFSKEDLED